MGKFTDDINKERESTNGSSVAFSVYDTRFSIIRGGVSRTAYSTYTLAADSETTPIGVDGEEYATSGYVEYSEDDKGSSVTYDKRTYGKDLPKETKEKLKGIPSAMNHFAVLTLSKHNNNNELILDNSANTKRWYDMYLPEDVNSHSPDTQTIISATNSIEWVTQTKGSQTYYFSDFAFCKHWNKIPNNYMITLRRFTFPTYDNLKARKEHPHKKLDDKGKTVSTTYIDSSASLIHPIATAVTYLGEATGNKLSEILKFETKLKWRTLDANVNEVTSDPQPDNNSTFGTRTAKIFNIIGMLSGDQTRGQVLAGGQLPPDPYTDGPLSNTIQGPVNCIKSITVRDQGLEYNHEMTIKFHYVARPYGGVNTKAVMMDILGNLLLLTTNSASFWGGMNKFRIASPTHSFIGGSEGLGAFMRGDLFGFGKAVIGQLSRAFNNVADWFKGLFSDPIKALENLASGVFGHWSAQKMSGQVPYLHGMRQLLTGDPTGEWHLTIGNPLNPIATIGNLVCTGMEIEFGEELGPDDFPLELTATVKLNHGMPRDKDAIESMFNRGHGRLYAIPDKYMYAIKRSTSYTQQSDANSGGSKVTERLENGVFQSNQDTYNLVNQLNEQAKARRAAFRPDRPKYRSGSKSAFHNKPTQNTGINSVEGWKNSYNKSKTKKLVDYGLDKFSSIRLGVMSLGHGDILRDGNEEEKSKYTSGDAKKVVKK